MDQGTAPFLYGLIFIAVILLVQGLYLTVFGTSIRQNSRINRRLARLAQSQSRDPVLDPLRKEMGQHRQARGIPLYRLLAGTVQKANIAITPRQLVLLMAGLVTLVFLVLSWTGTAGLALRLLLSLGLGVGGVCVWVHRKARIRMARLEEQLPDAVELIVRSLRVGHPFATAIAAVAREVQDPIGTEFGLIADEAAYGRNIAESLRALADRMGNQDLHFLAVAVAIQQQSGGNLAEILDGLAKVIRARFKLFRRVRAITAEAKFSGLFLSAFPLVAIVIVQIVMPGYYDEVRQTDYFLPAAVFVGVMLAINILFMRMMVNIKV
ncbi:MAG: hypothetical protein RIT14_2018 [Pseudomonadota bacterium]|jgi:tight adherence protein B